MTLPTFGPPPGSTSPPTVGRSVHYVARGSADGLYPPACRAAIISEPGYAHATTIGLAVLNPSGLFFDRDVEYDAGRPAGGPMLCDGLAHAPGTWHWPARV